MSQKEAAAVKAEALKGVPSGTFDCGNFNHYACERKIHSPNADNLIHILNECLPGGAICVDVEERQFRSSERRVELRCYHRYLYNGVAVFEGEGDSLEQALAAAMKSCESLGESE